MYGNIDNMVREKVNIHIIMEYLLGKGRMVHGNKWWGKEGVWVLKYREVNKWSRFGWKGRVDGEMYGNIENMMTENMNIHIMMGSLKKKGRIVQGNKWWGKEGVWVLEYKGVNKWSRLRWK